MVVVAAALARFLAVPVCCCCGCGGVGTGAFRFLKFLAGVVVVVSSGVVVVAWWLLLVEVEAEEVAVVVDDDAVVAVVLRPVGGTDKAEPVLSLACCAEDRVTLRGIEILAFPLLVRGRGEMVVESSGDVVGIAVVAGDGSGGGIRRRQR